MAEEDKKIDWSWDGEVPCPVCGLYNFECCGWENDGYQYLHPDFTGDANSPYSLNSYRESREKRLKREKK